MSAQRLLEDRVKIGMLVEEGIPFDRMLGMRTREIGDGFAVLEPLAEFGGLTVAAQARYGEGTVTAIGFGESGARYAGIRTRSVLLRVYALSGLLAGIAGALYVPQVGIINPSEFSPANSIEIVIWVAVGGRGYLHGALLGAVLVNYAKTYLTGAAPDIWLFFLSGLFIAVTVLLPGMEVPPVCIMTVMPHSLAHWTIGAASSGFLTVPNPTSPTVRTPSLAISSKSALVSACLR